MNSETGTPFTASLVEEKLEDSLELDIQVETVESSEARGELSLHTITTCALC
jgi:hypothetical protein